MLTPETVVFKDVALVSKPKSNSFELFGSTDGGLETTATTRRARSPPRNCASTLGSESGSQGADRGGGRIHVSPADAQMGNYADRSR